jgi:Xaa-Pro aminopeptidase
MRTPKHDLTQFAERRRKLADTLKGATLILVSHPEMIRNNDVHYPYRQDSNFFYFTGFEEPNSVFVFRPGQTPETVMFVQPKDVSKETWTGFRYGPEGAKNQFHMEQTHSIDELNSVLPKLIKDSEKVYYTMFINREFDATLLKMSEEIGLLRSRTNKGHLNLLDARPLLGEMRIRKTAYEVQTLRKACQITSEAHIEVMRATRPGVNERTLHGVFLQAIMERGCDREGYGSIVATGANATTLHYVFNDQTCRDGEVLLVDAGGEYNFYTSDITRSYPVNGKFNKTQARVYQKVLDLQKKLVQLVKPGQTRESLQKTAITGLTEIMVDENLLKGSIAQLIEQKAYLKFYPHGVGHWLGLDVHDAGLTEIAGEPRQLEPGFVMTIEPGLYVPQDTPGISDDLRGLGIRIEDDILVTADGHENMTAACPKDIDALESIIGRR